MARNFFDLLEKYPPILCRLLANNGHGQALSIKQLTHDSGLASYTIEALSKEVNWDSVPIGDCKRFLKACRMDLTNPKRMQVIEVYLRGKKRPDGTRIAPSFLYLRKNRKMWEEYYSLLMRHYLESQEKVISHENSQE